MFVFQLRRQLWNVTFEKEGVMYKFDENGDINLGYDILLWDEQESEGHSKIAEYDPSSGNFTFTTKNLTDFKVICTL